MLFQVHQAAKQMVILANLSFSLSPLPPQPVPTTLSLAAGCGE